MIPVVILVGGLGTHLSEKTVVLSGVNGRVALTVWGARADRPRTIPLRDPDAARLQSVEARPTGW